LPEGKGFVGPELLVLRNAALGILFVFVWAIL
jgi:hypothetical protein